MCRKSPRRNISNQPAFARQQCGLRAVQHAELAENIAQMVLHRAFGQVQRDADFLVALALGEFLQHLDLAARQFFLKRRVGDGLPFRRKAVELGDEGAEQFILKFIN